MFFQIASLVKSVYSRAIRNCSWVGDLWSRYLLSLECVSATEDELSKVFERSLQCIFSSIEEYLDLFLTRIDSLRRLISEKGVTDNGGLKFDLIRETFERASDYLSPHAKNSESYLRLHAYWSRLEMTLAKDLTAAREVWERFTKSSALVEGWLSYMAMEIELGHINEARSIYRRCYSRRFPGTGSEGLAYIDFSDEEHLAAAVAKKKEKLLGQRLSIARSNPKQSQKRASAGGSAMRGRGRNSSSDEHNKVADANEPPTQSSTFVSHRRGHLQLKGSNTFAMPRSVARPLGWINKDPVKDQDGDGESEKPKPNEEFRKLLTKN